MSKDAFVIARIDLSEKKNLERMARKLGISVSALLRKIISKHVQKENSIPA